MTSIRYRPLFALLALAATFAFAVTEADARSRGSVGSRGARTHSAPPPTATAPNAARPMERTATQPGQPGASTVARGPTTPATAQPGGLLSRPGLLGGLAAGFLGAGLFGLLAGHGLMGGLGGIASFLGLLLQVGIVAIVGMLIWRWWRNRSQPAAAYAGGPSLNQAMTEPRPTPSFSGLGGLGGGFGRAQPAPEEAFEPKPEDFDTFERLLGEIQTAYGKEDLGALHERLTPEMLSYYSEELAKNQANGDRNELSDIKLLQGDLAEAWREGNEEYATVAMRYSLNDRFVDRKDGRLIEQLPSEVTELWTFRRNIGGKWRLTAIQQTDA